MTINTTIPTNLRRPGAYHEFLVVQNALQLVPIPARVVIVAEKSSAGTATAETPVQIFDEADADGKAGAGSLAALMARMALAQAKRSIADAPGGVGGVGSPEIWLCPLTPTGTAAAYTITVTGPATASGDLVFTLAGRTITVGVSNGDSANTIAAAIEAKLDSLASQLPVTASVATNVVTLTFNTAGVNGNDVERTTIKTPSGVSLAHAASVAGAGTISVANALAALYDRRYHAIVLSTHVTGDAATVLADRALAWSYNAKNYRHYFLGERGSLGTATTLAAAYNDYGVVVASYEGAGNLPGEIAAAVATAEFAHERPNANLDGERLVLYPTSGALAYTAPEIESALAAGVTPLSPDSTFTRIERLVTTQITINSAPSDANLDMAASRTDAYVAEQLDIGYRLGFRQEVMDDDPEGDIRQRVRDMVIDKHRAMQRDKILRDVDTFLEQIQVEYAVSPAGRLLVTDPYRVAGPVHQAAFIHTRYL